MKKYDAYKPSGIEWIGEVPAKWDVKRGKYIVRLLSGFPADSDLFTDDDSYMPLIRIRDIDNITTETYYRGDYPIEYLIKKDDILVGMDGDFNIAKWKGSDAILNQRVCKIIETNEMYSHYAFYLFRTPLKLINDITYSTTVKHLSTNDIKDYRFPVPPLPEQTAIADYLDAKCAKIDNVVAVQRKRIELLKELKQSIITHAVTKGLDKTAQMKDSGIDWIGKVPECWETRRLKFVCSKITDGSHFSPQTQEEGKSYVTVSDVNDDVIDYINSPKISIEDFNNLVKNGCQPQVGDVLLAKDGTVGRTAIVEKNDFVVLSSLGILSPGYNNSKFLKYLLDSDVLQQQMINSMAGSALQRITISKIVNFIGLVPPLEEQTAIADYLDKKCAIIDRQKAKVEKQIELLNEYKQSVITECVTGKRKVC